MFHWSYQKVILITWVDQKVLKLLAYLFEYTMELYKTYRKYKANISHFCNEVWMTQYARINVTSSFDDVMQQLPGQKNDENFSFKAKKKDQHVLWMALFSWVPIFVDWTKMTHSLG